MIRMIEVDSETAVEEQFAGEGTGVEVEGNEESDATHRPWDPEKIRVSTKNFSLRNVLDMIDNEDLEIAPDFQRNRVWKDRQKSRLIESLLLQIPLPAFYFAEDEDGLLRVVDGLQRLSTIHGFVRGEEFALKDLEYLQEGVEGEVFGALQPSLQRRLYNAQIVVHVIDPTTPEEVKYDIFKRINTGGEPLNAMEIRHCMSRTRSRSFLARCVASDAFDLATSGKLRNHVRMHDREAALRFCAFRLLEDVAEYESHGSLERLLDWAARELDNPARVSEIALERLYDDFVRAMQNATYLFGVHAFRKWPTGSDRLQPINRALLESWSSALADVTREQLEPVRAEVVEKARKMMAKNVTYVDSISSSTSDARRVKTRFRAPVGILESVLA
jgi:hypothetical protein